MLKLGIETNAIPPSVLIAKEDVTMDNAPPIGYGGFGNVHEGTYRGNRVAIKRLHSRTIDKVGVCHPWIYHNLIFVGKALIREVSMWRTISHDYVLPFIGTYEDSGFIHLVSPFMENGTLSRWRRGEDPSTDEVRKRVLMLGYYCFS